MVALNRVGVGLLDTHNSQPALALIQINLLSNKSQLAVHIDILHSDRFVGETSLSWTTRTHNRLAGETSLSLTTCTHDRVVGEPL